MQFRNRRLRPSVRICLEGGQTTQPYVEHSLVLKRPDCSQYERVSASASETTKPSRPIENSSPPTVRRRLAAFLATIDG